MTYKILPLFQMDLKEIYECIDLFCTDRNFRNECDSDQILEYSGNSKINSVTSNEI